MIICQDADDGDEIVIRGLVPELVFTDPGNPKGIGRNVGERERPLRQLHPVQGHQPRHLGKADRDDDEIGATDLERQFADRVAAQTGDDHGHDKTDNRRPRRMHNGKAARQLDVESQRGQGAGIGANAKEGDMAEA
jgi:hypothetical protein